MCNYIKVITVTNVHNAASLIFEIKNYGIFSNNIFNFVNNKQNYKAVKEIIVDFVRLALINDFPKKLFKVKTALINT